MKRFFPFAGSLVLFSIFFVLFSFYAHAHKPVDTTGPATRENPIEIKEHRVSWAAYNELKIPGEVHFYRLDGVKKGEKIYLSLLVPQLERLESFFPLIALLGPGLETDFNGLEEEFIPEILRPEVGEGLIVRQFKDGQESSFFEPFTQTRYWERQEMNLLAPATGTYYAAVFDFQGNTDKYVFAIGDEERWGLKDILGMPRIWWDVRMFMEKETSTYITAGVLVSSAVFFTIWLLKR